MGSYNKSLIILCLFFLLVGITSVHAQWVEDGVPICTEMEAQGGQHIISYGAEGAIIVWEDNRSGISYDIYAQRIDDLGNILWTVNGVAICMATGNQQFLQITTDNAGGAIIVWADKRGGPYDIYSQRIDANGNVLWAENGIVISEANRSQHSVQLIPDGAGGAIITWCDCRTAIDNDIYAQRVDKDGYVQWTTDGVAVCTATGNQGSPQIESDGTGGAIITWEDYRIESGIYAQRIDADSVVQWTANGVAVCTATGDQGSPQIESDGAGGAIIVWQDQRSGDWDIYAQRIDSDSVVQWMANGVAICTETGDQHYPQIESDGAGGAIITWQDWRTGIDEYEDIYAQRIDTDSVVRWTANGVAICTAIEDQYEPELISDGAGGAIIVWRDNRDGHWDAYAQRISSDGVTRWTVDGVAVCTATGYQMYTRIEPDGAGGAYIVWYDGRSGNYDIYAQRIGRNGHWGYYPAPVISAVQDVPKDQGGKICLQWEASFIDMYPDEVITHYSVWRRLPLEGAGVLGHVDKEQLQEPDTQIDFNGSTVCYPFQSSEYSWDWLANVPARYFESYALTVQSLYDSMGTDTGWQHFMVAAHTDTPSVYYVSRVDSGYSVDNLSPGQPLGLTGRQSCDPEGMILTWDPNTDPDILCYTVYRGLSEDFTPGQGNLIGSVADTALFDNEWRRDSGFYYKVAAVDLHGNTSLYTLLTPEDVIGEKPYQVPETNYLAQNFPNPFNPTTTITFGLKEQSEVSLRIYDASGKLVRVLVEGTLDAGPNSVAWDATHESGRTVASGIYFCRLVAGEFIETKKMILLR